MKRLGRDRRSTLTPQQQKMKTCNADAKTKALKGDDRKKFMSDCLKGHEPERKPAGTQRAADETSSQHNRMKACNEDARERDLHGDERRAFMSTCLKGS